MDSEASSAIRVPGIVPRLFPSLGPALLISMGYIDLGKWAAAVDGGTRFGFDLVLLVLALNCTAILCQYLAARVSLVTGKNLAQICSEEYNRPTCMLLGVQAELSVIVSDLTMILGIAHGLNLLFGLDLFICVFLSAMDAVLFPLFITLLDKCMMEKLFASIAGLALLFYVFGVLISQPEIPLNMSWNLPSLKGENAYTLMSLLGANIMPHGFYLHSYIVQQHRPASLSTSSLCHDHFLAILVIFSGIFLVNYVVMLSAATVFQSASLLTFQDMLLLMDQIFRSPVAPFAFFVVLFFSSQVTALTWTLGGQVLLHDFFGINPHIWLHRLTIKALAIIPAIFCAWNSGDEGVYQLLIFSQVILAMLLPSSVIPLFRVASSGFIMGAFKISSFAEILALSAFLWMLVSKIIFIVEMLFGDSDWMGNLGWYTGSSMTLPYILVLLIACASFSLMLWLAATPLKSASDGPNMQIWNLDLQKDLPGSREDREENELNRTRDDGEDHLSEKEALDKSVVSHSDNSVEFNLDLPKTVMPSDCEPYQSNDGENYSPVSTSQTFHLEESTSAVELASVETVDEVSAGALSDERAVIRTESKDPVGMTGGVEGDMPAVVKDDDEADVWEPEESQGGISGSVPTSASEGPGSFRSVSGKSEDGSSGSGSLSRLDGLGRAARRQLAAILDEFWGQLYDFHGQVTPEAKAKRIDAVLGMEQKPIPCTKADAAGDAHAMKYFPEAERGSAFRTKSRDYGSPMQQRVPSSLESSYEAQKDTSSWSSYLQSLDAYVQSSGSYLLDASERRYSSLRLPSYSDDRDYQPATIHGYQIASYLSRIATERNMDSLRIPLESTTKSTSLIQNYRDPLAYSMGQNGLGSLHVSSMQNPAVSISSRLQAERPYYDSSLGASENVGSSASPKKYHSLPDISGLAVSNRASLSENRNAQWGNSIGPEPSAGRIPYERSLYGSTASRAAGVPLAFDELSPSKRYRDPFLLPPSSNLETKSLWSRQPYEQLFGVSGKPQSGGHGVLQGTVSHAESKAKLLQSFRYCIMKLLKLEGSDWLFRQNGGFDEELIDQVAAREKFLHEAEAREVNQVHADDSPCTSSERKFSLRNEAGLDRYLVSLVPHCGEGCIWQVGLIVSFGIWCIRRILELSLMESRPELWGKYTYVLNRLQGILDLAFFKPRSSISPCFCLQIPSIAVKRFGPPPPDGLSPTSGKAGQGRCTSASMLLDLIKDVEAAVSGRKGKMGTTAGDVAFPKGKENLASVLKRYKRRLSNKSAGTHEGGPGARKIPTSAFSFTP
ncbi:ethylene-insensitive protein 2.2-like isoform X2 [Magnolia sinica]|uniref:ethylene-insensitive protein 2.2-like isoform X2 n=1 Tax=Magnolia sinica TaxID=86752 RepID=UPI00265B5DAD|nr:ethylene-insensitive protein 2.2-like isoform X2 [Magnolia sinica]